jgi:hypothetical protein
LLSEIRGLNELSGLDKALIFSNVKITYNKQYNCVSCKKRFNQEYRDKKRHCAASASKPVAIENGVKFFRCMGNYFNSGYICINDIVRNYRNGVLPFSGGIMEQPCKIMEMILTAESLIIEEEREQQRKANGR